MRKVAFAVLLFAAVSACDEEAIGPGHPAYAGGALGVGGFVYQCDGSVVCTASASAASTFPATLALGSRFRVRWVPADATNTKPITIGTVSDTYLEHAPSGELVAKHAGWASLVAYDDKGAIVDFLTRPIVAPDSLGIFGTGDSHSELTVGTAVAAPVYELVLATKEMAVLRAVARHDGLPLAGQLSYSWSSSDPSIASIEYDMLERATVRGLAKGHTTVVVTSPSSQGLSASLDVTVD